MNLKKAKEEKNCLVRELRVINMVDTLVVILSLQNAMIIASGGSRIGMQPVTIGSSTVIFVLIVVITVRSMVVNR